MPPKKKGGRRKKKVVEPPVAKPEPMDCDEVEANMMWDRIAPIAPNPLSTAPQLYTFATTQAISSGPPPAVVVGLASANVPLLSPHPPATPGSATAKEKRPRDDNQPVSPGAATARSNADLKGSATTAESKSQQPDGFQGLMRHQSGFFAPQPPPRNPKVDEWRAAMQVHKAEREMQEKQALLEEKTKDNEEVDGSIAAQKRQFDDEKNQLRKDIEENEEELRKTIIDNEEKLEEQKQMFATEKCTIEEEMKKLKAHDPRVQADLADKAHTLSEIEKMDNLLKKLKKDHVVAVEREKLTLSEELRKLKETMVARLKKTMEEMEQLTQQHRDRRQQKAVSESARLVAKLSTLEGRSKRLTTENTKLTLKAESTRRDQILESERHQLLARKSQQLSKEIRDVSAQLQSYEKMYAEKAASASQSEQVISLSETIDRQYQIILELKHELDGVRRDSAETKQRLEVLRQRHFMALKGNQMSSGLATAPLALSVSGRSNLAGSLNGSSSGSPRATMSASAAALLADDPPEVKARIRGIITKSVKDIDATMRAMSEGQRGIEDVTDPREQVELVNYIITRINNYRSGVFPSTPRASTTPGSQELKPLPPPPTELLSAATTGKQQPALPRISSQSSSMSSH